MFEWLKKIITSRYVKSFSRYIITALAAMLVGSNIPGLAELSMFIKTHAGELSDILGTILMGLVTWWSIKKNMHNSEDDKESK